MLPTHLITVDGTVLQQDVGFTYLDALDYIWSGDGPTPSCNEGSWQVWEVGFEPGMKSVCNDVTDTVYHDLCRRTHERYETPKHLHAWLEWCGLEPYRVREAA